MIALQIRKGLNQLMGVDTMRIGEHEFQHATRFEKFQFKLEAGKYRIPSTYVSAHKKGV